jgi:hypothetical protein
MGQPGAIMKELYISDLDEFKNSINKLTLAIDKVNTAKLEDIPTKAKRK